MVSRKLLYVSLMSTVASLVDVFGLLKSSCVPILSVIPYSQFSIPLYAGWAFVGAYIHDVFSLLVHLKCAILMDFLCIYFFSVYVQSPFVLGHPVFKFWALGGQVLYCILWPCISRRFVFWNVTRVIVQVSSVCQWGHQYGTMDQYRILTLMFNNGCYIRRHICNFELTQLRRQYLNWRFCGQTLCNTCGHCLAIDIHVLSSMRLWSMASPFFVVYFSFHCVFSIDLSVSCPGVFSHGSSRTCSVSGDILVVVVVVVAVG